MNATKKLWHIHKELSDQLRRFWKCVSMRQEEEDETGNIWLLFLESKSFPMEKEQALVRNVYEQEPTIDRDFVFVSKYKCMRVHVQ